MVGDDMSSTGDIFLVGVGSGIVAGLLVLFAQWSFQAWYDHLSPWPFDAVLIASEPVVASMPTRTRVVFRNKMSGPVRVIPEPIDANGRPINGWHVRDGWGGAELGVTTAIEPRSWREIWIEGPTMVGAPRPTRIKFEVWSFTFRRGKERVYEIDFLGSQHQTGGARFRERLSRLRQMLDEGSP